MVSDRAPQLTDPSYISEEMFDRAHYCPATSRIESIG
jgi:hypothetical protein